MPSTNNKGLRILLWLGCSVVLAFLPIGVNWGSLYIHDQPHGYVTLFTQGEAFLIASALTADAIGRASLGGASKRGFRVVCLVASLILLVSTACYFGVISADLETHRRQMEMVAQSGDAGALLELWRKAPFDVARVVNASLGLLVPSILTALGVILVEES
jgi:hypothetical protein